MSLQNRIEIRAFEERLGSAASLFLLVPLFDQIFEFVGYARNPNTGLVLVAHSFQRAVKLSILEVMNFAVAPLLLLPDELGVGFVVPLPVFQVALDAARRRTLVVAALRHYAVSFPRWLLVLLLERIGRALAGLSHLPIVVDIHGVAQLIQRLDYRLIRVS